MGIICHDNTINYLDFLRALESSKAARPQREEKEDAVPINFSTLNPEEVVKSVQEVVSTSQQALSQVRTGRGSLCDPAQPIRAPQPALHRALPPCLADHRCACSVKRPYSAWHAFVGAEVLQVLQAGETQVVWEKRTEALGQQELTRP